MLRLTLAVVHLLALGVGLGAVWARAGALRGPVDSAALRRAFAADTWWGVAAGLWISTGLWRLLGSTEKSTRYYLDNYIFLSKMGMLLLILGLEVWPMVTLIRWRRAGSRLEMASEQFASKARMVSTISYVELALVVLMVISAVSMARGYGMGSQP